MPKSRPAIVVAVAMLVAAGILGYWFLTRPSELPTKLPRAEPSVLSQLPATNARFSVPVVISLDALIEAMDERIPRKFSRRGTWKKLFVEGTWTWEATRGPLERESSTARELDFVTGVGGRVRVNPGPNLDFGLRVSGVLRPTLQADWAIQPNYSVDVELTKPNVLPSRPIDMEGWVEDAIEDEIEGYQAEVAEAVSSATKEAARRAWAGLCRTIPVPSAPGFWLQTRPVAASSTALRFDGESALLTLGLDSQLLVSTVATKPSCRFPSQLVLEESTQSGSFEILLPINLAYAELASMLRDQVEGRSYGDDVSVTIQSIGLRAHGSGVLIETVVHGRLPGWWQSDVKGTVFVLATPILDPDAQTLSFTDVELDTQSRQALAAALGEIGESWVLDAFQDRSVFGVGPRLEELRGHVNTLLAGLSSDRVEIGVTIETLRVRDIEIGSSAARVVASVAGRIAASVPHR